MLINVAKRGKVERAVIECNVFQERLVIRVSDRGVGYDTAAVWSRPGRGLGLISILERLAKIGGNTEIHSAPGEGTLVILRQAGDAADGLAQVTALQPDVVVLDIRLPDSNGMEVVARLRDAGIANLLASEVLDGPLAADSVSLGRRELEVLRLIAEGMRSPRIAQELHVSLGTVEVHRRNIMRKLHLHAAAGDVAALASSAAVRTFHLTKAGSCRRLRRMSLSIADITYPCRRSHDDRLALMPKSSRIWESAT